MKTVSLLLICVLMFLMLGFSCSDVPGEAKNPVATQKIASGRSLEKSTEETFIVVHPVYDAVRYWMDWETGELVKLRVDFTSGPQGTLKLQEPGCPEVLYWMSVDSVVTTMEVLLGPDGGPQADCIKRCYHNVWVRCCNHQGTNPDDPEGSEDCLGLFLDCVANCFNQPSRDVATIWDYWKYFDAYPELILVTYGVV